MALQKTRLIKQDALDMSLNDYVSKNLMLQGRKTEHIWEMVALTSAATTCRTAQDGTCRTLVHNRMKSQSSLLERLLRSGRRHSVGGTSIGAEPEMSSSKK